MQKLTERGDCRIFKEETGDPRELLRDSPFVQSYRKGGTAVRCYLAPASANVTYRFIEKRDVWHIDDQSEVVQFTGFDFDGKVLLQGRLYYQIDYLEGMSIVPKSSSFVRWAERIFRMAKKEASYSAKLQAYVGKGAEAFYNDGGHFAAMIIPNREPIYEVL